VAWTGCGRRAASTDSPIHETPGEQAPCASQKPGVNSPNSNNARAAKSMGGGMGDHLFETEQYSLQIETETSDMEDAYNNDTTVVLGPGDVGGSLVVFVNDSPARLHCRGSGIFPIFALLQPGSNAVRIEGKHRSRMFIKVLTLDPKQFAKPFTGTYKATRVVAKTWLDATKDSVTLRFDAAVPNGPDWEELPQDEDKLDAELTCLIDKWIGWCKNHDADALICSWIPDLKKPPAYLTTRDQARKRLRAGNNPVTDRSYRLLTEGRDIRYVSGKRTVILFAGTDAGLPILFRFSNDVNHNTCCIGAITLGRLEGHWVVEHIMK
jgi:hypothetical protein